MDKTIAALTKAQAELSAAGYDHAAEAVGNALSFIAAKQLRDNPPPAEDPVAHAKGEGYAPSITQEG